MLLLLRLGEAAADGDHEVGILTLARAGVAEVGGELRVGLLADRARVEDDEIGLILRDGLPQTERLEHAFDALGVVAVHLTAKGGQVVAAHGGSVGALPGSSLTLGTHERIGRASKRDERSADDVLPGDESWADRLDFAWAANGRPRTKVRLTGRSCSTQRDPIVSTVQPSNVQRPTIIRHPSPGSCISPYATVCRSRNLVAGRRQTLRPPGVAPS